MSKIGNLGGELLDYVNSTVGLSTASNEAAATVTEARARAIASEALNSEVREAREQIRKDKMLATSMDVLYIVLAMSALGFFAWLILYVRKNS